jgi:hypothetical protein
VIGGEKVRNDLGIDRHGVGAGAAVALPLMADINSCSLADFWRVFSGKVPVFRYLVCQEA